MPSTQDLDSPHPPYTRARTRSSGRCGWAVIVVALPCIFVSGLPAVAPPAASSSSAGDRPQKAGRAAGKVEAQRASQKQQDAPKPRRTAEPAHQDSPWVQAARKRLTPVSKRELNALRSELADALNDLDARLSDIPDGARWRAAWRVDALQSQLEAASVDVAKLQGIEAAFALPPPPELKASQHAVRNALRLYAGAAALTPESAKQFDKALALLDDVRQGRSATVSVKDQAAVRDAYQKLAATHRLHDLLEEFRADYSQSNYRMMLTDDYVAKRATRHIEAPLRFSQQAGRIHLQVQAQAKADVSAVLVPNDDRAEIRVTTKGLIPATINGSTNRIRLTANSTQNLTATQTLYLGPDGIDTPGPQVCDCSHTALACLELCLRFPLLRRIGERIVSRIASQKIAEKDPEIARKIEQGMSDRIGEEGYDIAFRLNGTFRKLYSDRLPKQADAPRLRIHSDADGIYWTALYANHDELGALAPPPVPASSLPFDMVLQLHESAIQSWAASLGGALLDEATFLNLFREDVGLESPTVVAREPARRSAVIRFAEQNPLQVKFAATGIELKLALHGFVDGAGPYAAAPKSATVRYRLAPGKSGIKLVRDAEDFSQDAKWSKVLDGFFPAEWTPVPQYANAEVGEKLMMRYLNIQDGWVIVGSSLSKPAGASAAAGE